MGKGKHRDIGEFYDVANDVYFAEIKKIDRQGDLTI
jgi:hypothetical protein